MCTIQTRWRTLRQVAMCPKDQHTQPVIPRDDGECERSGEIRLHMSTGNKHPAYRAARAGLTRRRPTSHSIKHALPSGSHPNPLPVHKYHLHGSRPEFLGRPTQPFSVFFCEEKQKQSLGNNFAWKGLLYRSIPGIGWVRCCAVY